VLKALSKLVSGRKIYAENNPRLEQFREEFATTLRQFFEFEDELVLTIQQYSIHWGEVVIYDNPRREESLAFILFKDGIGELTIMPRAIGPETDRLVQILADELHHVGQDEDVVTRFWNADFENITYRVLDDYLASEFGDGATEADADRPIDETADQSELLPSLSDKGRVFINHSHTLESIDALLRDISRQHHPEGTAEEMELAYQRLLRTTFSIPVDEIDIYRAELERERVDDGIASFVESVFVFMLISDNPTAVRDVSSVLERLVDFSIAEKNPATLQRIIGFIREFRARAELPEHVRKFCEKAIARLSDPTLVSVLLELLSSSDGPMDVTMAYATTVGPGAVEPLVRALHRIEGSSVHRRICDALIAISPQTAAGVIERLDIDHPEIAVDAVYMAKALNLEALSPRLRELVFYPDARVKLEMLGWIAARDGADSTELLISSLADLDKRVRLRVLDALCDRKEPRVRECLTELAFAKGLSDRTADEQEAVFKTLGHVGDANTVSLLRAFVERRKLISLGKGSDPKYLAIRALERIRDDGAVALLTRLAEDPSEAVRLRAQRAKETLLAGMSGAPDTQTRTERRT